MFLFEQCYSKPRLQTTQQKYFSEGFVLAKQKKYDQAIAQFAKCIDPDPGNADASFPQRIACAHSFMRSWASPIWLRMIKQRLMS